MHRQTPKSSARGGSTGEHDRPVSGRKGGNTIRKFATILLALACFTAGSAFAQPADIGTHGAVVAIPLTVSTWIRFTLGTSTSNVALPDQVEFVFTTATYSVGTFGPTNPSFNWDDIKVFHNDKSPWEVVVTTVGSPGFDWSKIGITPTIAAPYDLGAIYTIETGTGKTSGWRSLGIDPWDYRIAMDGTENPGTYTALVIFTLQSP